MLYLGMYDNVLCSALERGTNYLLDSWHLVLGKFSETIDDNNNINRCHDAVMSLMFFTLLPNHVVFTCFRQIRVLKFIIVCVVLLVERLNN